MTRVLQVSSKCTFSNFNRLSFTLFVSMEILSLMSSVKPSRGPFKTASAGGVSTARFLYCFTSQKIPDDNEGTRTTAFPCKI